MISKSLRNTFSRQDWVLFAATVFLVIIGLISIFSTSHPVLTNFYKQIVWALIGIALCFVLSSIDYRLFRVHFSPVLFLYLVGVLGVLAVYFFGTTIRGGARWLVLGPVQIEPVEPLKLILILILAKYFSTRHVDMYRFRHIVVSAFYVLVPAALILLQPDLGSFIILTAIWLGIIVITGIKLKHLLVVGLVALVLVAYAWSFLLYDYQKDRISVFMNPAEDPLGSGYNTLQAMIAVGSGGYWGKGFGQGTQSQLGFLPESHTDFIYAAIVEEFGAFMGLLILMLYGIIFWRMVTVFRIAEDNFARLTIIGISIVLIFQVFFNIAMILGRAPITGITLPFVSYGGSSLVTLFIAMGIVQSIYRHSGMFSRLELESSDVELV